jgi:thiamine transport system permease protein
MKKNFSSLPVLSLIVLWLAPFGILFFYRIFRVEQGLRGASYFWPVHTGDIILFTLKQAFISTLASLLYGFVGALGLLSFRKNKSLFEGFILVPHIAPVLFIIVSFVNFFPGVRGLVGIISLHTILNSGLVAVIFSRVLAQKAAGWSELAYVEGASGWLFFRRGLWPLFLQDLMFIGLFVFILSFSSFTVPLMIGGSRATTLEVLIYENIRAYSSWPQAVSLAFLQAIFILSLSFFIKQAPFTASSNSKKFYLLKWRPGLILMALPTFLILSGLLKDLPEAVEDFKNDPKLLSELLPLISNSLFVALLTGLLTLFFLFFLAISRQLALLRRFFLGYSAPSAVLTGFALLIVWRATGFATLIKISLGVTFLAVPAMYRLRWSQALQDLHGQIQTAQTLGASRLLIAQRLLVPQLWQEGCRLAALASVWAWGDFALSRVVAEAPVTVALQTQSLMDSYRLVDATLFVWILMFGALMTYILFEGLGHVAHTKFES